jgi:ATP-dependent Clp protease ATP-binding subunit ClpX
MAEIDTQCSFCGRQKSEVEILIAGMTGHICDQCIDQADQILLEERSQVTDDTFDVQFNLEKPIDIKRFLDDYVIGQESAKRTLSVAVYNHYKRLSKADEVDESGVEIDKSNVILVGETGTGKTLLARSIARLLKVPFCIADATILTEAGYVGEDVESVLSRLLQAADYDVASAERGIVFIDEIDKGSEVNVPPQGGRKHPEQKLISIDTKNILFICGGAFSGIERHIERRIGAGGIGFSAEELSSTEDEVDTILSQITPSDLKSFGLIPELVGRFPVLTHLKALNADALRRILTEPKNALVKQYMKLFQMDGIELHFDADALDFIVERAMEFKLGARGLRSICEAVLSDAMFELPGKEDVTEFRLTGEYAKKCYNATDTGRLRVA